MTTLILGATGFIGNALFNALVSEHRVIVASRTPIDEYPLWREVDFNKEIDFEELLKEIDIVINAIGIPSGNFQKIQTEIPIQIFQRCKENKVKIINISAIGAEKQNPSTDFLQSKKMADDFVISNTSGKIIYPGIVLGNKAKSSELFKELSNLPVTPIFSDKKIPFVHISQLIESIKQNINQYNEMPSQQIIVGEPETLKEIFTALKNKPIKALNIPMGLIDIWFKIFPKFNIGVFDKSMFTLFKEINAKDYKPIYGKASAFLSNNDIQAGNDLLKFSMLLSIAFIWIWSGFISLYSWNESLNLMKVIGITNFLAPLSVIAGSVVDIVLGIGVFYTRHRKIVLKLQIFIIVVYSLILTFGAFEFWLHPFGPIAKNIPLLALIYLYYKWNDRNRL